jgi:hypothetical protein
VTSNRLFIVLFPASISLKNPLIAIYSTIATVLILFAMHSHEIFAYQTIQEPNSPVLMCVPKFHHNAVAVYHRVNTLIHYLIPFSIQIIFVTLLISSAARSRAKTANAKITLGQLLKKQFIEQKELYVTPMIIILAALPQSVLSFSLACTPLDNWKRHVLLAAFILSYSPQILGFLLYVLPSTAYRKEFLETQMAKKYFTWMFKT